MAGVLVAASTLAAQRPAPARPRDSIVVRVLSPSMIVLDSLNVLMREFDREQAGTQRWLVLRGRIDSLVGMPGAFAGANIVRGVLAEAGRVAAEARRGSLGFSTQGPTLRAPGENGDLLITQLSHPTIVSVDPQSPAGRAGILAGDELVAYNGVDVVNHEFSLNALLKPDSKVTVTVSRDGETKNYQLTVAKAPARTAQRRIDFETFTRPGIQGGAGVGAFGGQRVSAGNATIVLPGEAPSGVVAARVPLIMLSGNGVLGASVSTVSAELAKALNLRAGVLVTDAPEESPAFRVGLRAGDVITAVGEQPVVSLSQLREMLMGMRAHTVALQVAHNQKTRIVTVGATPSP